MYFLKNSYKERKNLFLIYNEIKIIYIKIECYKINVKSHILHKFKLICIIFFKHYLISIVLKTDIILLYFI